MNKKHCAHYNGKGEPMNCWEFKGCERETGGAKAKELGKFLSFGVIRIKK